MSVKNLAPAALDAVRNEANKLGGAVVGAHRRRERLETLFLQVVERERVKTK